MPRHFLRDDDLTPAEQAEVLDLARAMKADRQAFRPLAGPKAVALLFDKPSLRTRVSFTVGVAELGGLPLEIDTTKTHIGRGETIADIARVLTRQVAAITWRTSGQDRIEELAGSSTVPVINALTDEFHPCQILADLQTVTERLGSLAGPHLHLPRATARTTWRTPTCSAGRPPGCTSGSPHRAATSPTRRSSPGHSRSPRGPAAPRLVLDDPALAVKGADVLATDVWVSMGQADAPERKAALAPYQVNGELLALAAPGAIVLHCLPAHRGEEITAEVIDGPASVVWDQAENRLHAQKALLAWLLGRS